MKKTIAMLLIMSMAILSLIACGSDESLRPTESPAAPSTSAAPETPAAEERHAAEAGVEAEQEMEVPSAKTASSRLPAGS